MPELVSRACDDKEKDILRRFASWIAPWLVGQDRSVHVVWNTPTWVPLPDVGTGLRKLLRYQVVVDQCAFGLRWKDQPDVHVRDRRKLLTTLDFLGPLGRKCSDQTVSHRTHVGRGLLSECFLTDGFNLAKTVGH